MPRLDRIMTEGRLMKWLKNEGEEVKKGETLAEIETIKATSTIEAPASGILHRIKPEGSTVPVDEPIASILQSTEAQELPELEGQIKRSITASPAARDLAKKRGINLAMIPGTGPEGAITRADVLSHLSKVAIPEVAASGVGREVEVIPLVGWRKTMADKMSFSMRTTAHVTTIAEADVTELEKLRERLKSTGIEISYTAFIVDAVVQALKGYPIINSCLVEDKIVIKKYYNIGLAVARPESGLVVVVVHDADKKNLAELSVSIEELAEKARKDKITLEDTREGTFTITNVGMFGAIINTPIINSPESAILGVGAIVKRPVVIQNEVVIRSVMNLCLTYDHRIVDGLPAIRFLQKVRQALEDPTGY